MKSPTALWQEIDRCEVAPGTVSLWWLYQAGIVVKSPGGTVLTIDAYLSDAAARTYDVHRKVAPPIDPAEVSFDAVLASHSHMDHLDPDAIAGFARHGATRFIGPPMVAERVAAGGVDPARTVALARGERTRVGDVEIRAVAARHPFAPEPVPDAIGFVLEVGPVSLYHSGDTEYDHEIINDVQGVTASLISMNGTAGNMNVHEAALLAWQLQARVAIPFHYGLWTDDGYGPGATIDPQQFVATYRRLGSSGRAVLLEPAQALVLGPGGVVG